MMRAGAVRSVDEEIVIEGGDIEEDGLVVEEEFREEGEILGEELECDRSAPTLEIRNIVGVTWCSSPSTS